MNFVHLQKVFQRSVSTQGVLAKPAVMASKVAKPVIKEVVKPVVLDYGELNITVVERGITVQNCRKEIVVKKKIPDLE